MKLTYLFSTFALLVSGLVIWSCSQEETDDVMTVYRYSSEEIATLRSMAEEYGIPNVKFITESAAELPTMDEMKEAFLMIASLNNISGSDVELVKKDETTLIFKTKVLNQPRLLKKAAESNSVGYDAGKFVQTAGTHMWLNISVKVTENKDDNNNLNPKPGRQISVNASLEIPEKYKLRGYSVENEKTTWSNQYEDLIIVNYTCDIILVQTVLIDDEWIERKTVEDNLDETVDVYLK